MSVPFTTPMLANCRLRPGRRGKPEALMPNPSGGRGLYVFDLAAASELGSLTLHDRLLIESIMALPAITPSEIRKAVYELAMHGAAGRKAAQAAAAAVKTDSIVRLLTQFHLLTCLFRHAGVKEIDWRRIEGGDRVMRATIKASLAKVAPQMGTSVDELFARIEVISYVAAPVGPPKMPVSSRNEVMLARLQAFITSVQAWAEGEVGAAGGDARAVLASAARTLREAGEAQDQARALLDDAVPVLQAWLRPEGERVRAMLSRAEWLLDGWDQPCGLWAAAARDARAAQRETMQQIRTFLPMLDPVERSDMPVVQMPDTRLDRGRRVKLYEDWRTGLNVVDDIARAELLRAENA